MHISRYYIQTLELAIEYGRFSNCDDYCQISVWVWDISNDKECGFWRVELTHMTWEISFQTYNLYRDFILWDYLSRGPGRLGCLEGSWTLTPSGVLQSISSLQSLYALSWGSIQFSSNLPREELFLVVVLLHKFWFCNAI